MGLLGLESQCGYALDGMIHYLVDTPDGAVGVLDRWERDQQGRPVSLIVSQGWFGRRRFEIPLEELIQIDHEARRIVLARGAAPLDRSLTQRLITVGPRHQSRDKRPALAESLRPLARRSVEWTATRQAPKRSLSLRGLESRRVLVRHERGA